MSKRNNGKKGAKANNGKKDEKKKTKKPSTPNATKEQMSMLVEYLSKHPKMYKMKFSPDYTKRDYRADWNRLSENLNQEIGPIKDVDQWMKVQKIVFYSVPLIFLVFNLC